MSRSECIPARKPSSTSSWRGFFNNDPNYDNMACKSRGSAVGVLELLFSLFGRVVLSMLSKAQIVSA